LEHEIRRETVQIAFDGLIQGFGFHAVKLGQIAVQHHFFAAN